MARNQTSAGTGSGPGSGMGQTTAGDPLEVRLRRALLSRATFGPTAVNRTEVDVLGFEGWLETQLHPEQIDDGVLDGKLADHPWLNMDAAQLRASYGGGGWTLSEQSKAVRLLRAAESERQLFERVVELWNEHFNVPFSAQDANYLRPPHEERVIRAHALGTFPELLRAVVKSPAMVAYLDQDSNVAGAPNENFARELLELYTLGEGTGYTEFDVVEVARCFTGWRYRRHWEVGTFGELLFEPSSHDDGEKVVLGRRVPAGGGPADVDIVLGALTRDPRCARRVAARIARWFLGEEGVGSASVMGELVDTYNATGGDIRAMVREVLSRGSLLKIEPWHARKLKAPFHYAVSLLRSIGARIVAPRTAIYALEGLGQVPFEWPDPDGYPEDPAVWSGGQAPRWRFASTLLNGWASWADVTEADLMAASLQAPPPQWVRAVVAALTGGEMEPRDVEAIEQFVVAAPAPGPADLIALFELGASSPSFQTY